MWCLACLGVVVLLLGAPTWAWISHDGTTTAVARRRRRTLLVLRTAEDNSLVETHVTPPAPLYITIGPPCSGKTEGLRQELLASGYNPDDVFERDVNNQQQDGLYYSLSLAAFLWPAKYLTNATAAHVLYNATTVADRLNDPLYRATDQELRSVLLRLAGRLTPRELASRCQAVQVVRQRRRFSTSPNKNHWARQRRSLAHDLARAVEQTVVQAVSEVICQMQLDKDEAVDQASQAIDDADHATLETRYASPTHLPTARILSERQLVGTSHIQLFVPQVLYQSAIGQAQHQLYKTLQGARPDQPVAWGNTNTRPAEYAAALQAAQQLRRPVEFVLWGHQYPSLPRQELLRRNVAKLRQTGRYLPAGAVHASLRRVENLCKAAERQRQTLFDGDNDSLNNDWQRNVALAALAGYYMDDKGFVTKVGEPQQIFPSNSAAAQHHNGRDAPQGRGSATKSYLR